MAIKVGGKKRDPWNDLEGIVPPPRKPADAMPTLAEVGDDMNLVEAGRLHVRATRWLEYVSRDLARTEGQLAIAQQKTGGLKKRLEFLHGEIKKASQAEFDDLQAAEEHEAFLKAKKMLLKGEVSGLNKIKESASRAITRQQNTMTTSYNWKD